MQFAFVTRRRKACYSKTEKRQSLAGTLSGLAAVTILLMSHKWWNGRQWVFKLTYRTMKVWRSGFSYYLCCRVLLKVVLCFFLFYFFTFFAKKLKKLLMGTLSLRFWWQNSLKRCRTWWWYRNEIDGSIKTCQIREIAVKLFVIKISLTKVGSTCLSFKFLAILTAKSWKELLQIK